MRSLDSYESVIWDWNGTLLDDVELALGIANELLVARDLPPLTPERYKQIFDFPVRVYYERAGLDFERYDFAELSATFCALFEERLHLAPLFSPVRKVLGAISRSGGRQFLLSGTEHETLQRMIERYELGDFFHGLKGLPNTFAESKTSAGQDLLSHFAIDPANALLIGDTTHDAEVAEALGIDCLLIAGGHHSYQRLAELPHPVLESLDELAKALVPADPS